MMTKARIAAAVALLASAAAAADFNLLGLLGGETESAPVKKTEQPLPAATNAPIAVVEPPVATNAPVAVATNVPPAVAVEEPAATNAPAAKVRKAPSRPVNVTAKKTFYDRKEGYAVFTGRVCVDDEEYQMHASKAYVFFDSTNEVKRIVAVGAVALTNGTKRAYGAKASYHRQSGMVVLYGGPGVPAEVRDERPGGAQTVAGGRIRFWTDAEQVEVLDAKITAPAGDATGAGALDMLKK